MSLKSTVILIGLTSSIVVLLLGCGRGGGGTVAEQLAEAALEAAMEQSISAYHTASGEVSVNGYSLGFSCARGGTGGFSKTESGNEFCWESTLEHCDFEGERGGKIWLSGNSKLCYASNANVVHEGIAGLADAHAITFEGSVTAGGQTRNGTTLSEKTCSYDATAEVSNGATNCVEIEVDGDISCGGFRDDDSWNPSGISLTICASGEVELNDSLAETVMEAILEQSISTYHTVSGQVSGPNNSVAFSCARSGTGTYEKTESTKVCWGSTLEGCDFEGDRGGKLALSGNTSLCYATAVSITHEGIEGLAEAGTIDFEGTVNASGVGPYGTEFGEASCSYDFSAAVTHAAEGNMSCAELDLDGDITCGSQSFNASGIYVKLCASAEVSVD